MDKISPRHFIFLILATGIVSLKTYPIVFIQDGKKESWIAVIISSILIFLFFLFAIKTIKLADGNLVKLYQNTLGKFIGNILIGFFAFTVFLSMVESASIEADSMHQNMLVETPHWYFMIFFIIPALYVIRKDLVAVIIITIIGISLIMVAGIHLGILTGQQKHISMLFPIFQDGITGGFFISILESLGMYGFISITFPYLHVVNDKKISLTKYSVIGLIILIQMQIVSITGIFMTFSLDTAESYYYPKLIQTHLVSYFQILEFGELYVMLQILGGWLLKYVVSFHALVQIFKFYNFKKRTIYISSFIISALVMGASYYLTVTSIRLFKWLPYLPWISLANFVVIPCIVFVIYRIKQKYKESLKSSQAPPNDATAKA